MMHMPRSVFLYGRPSHRMNHHRFGIDQSARTRTHLRANIETYGDTFRTCICKEEMVSVKTAEMYRSRRD